MIEKFDLIEELKKIDREFVSEIDPGLLKEELDVEFSGFSDKFFKQEHRAIVGLDIFEYSQFQERKQVLIPFVFDLILDQAIHYCRQTEKTLFKDYDFRGSFISTGDGGFIRFPTPLQALFFTFNFYTSLHNFNSGHNYPKLSIYLGELVIRCAITFDSVYAYDGNFYGAGIILNSRILSKDKLNRLLIDKNTYDYFMKNFNGLESLPIVSKAAAQRVLKIEGEFESAFFESNLSPELNSFTIRNIHIQKVDNLLAKKDQLTIYNVEIQFLASLADKEDHSKLTNFIFSIGNSNSISERKE